MQFIMKVFAALFFCMIAAVSSEHCYKETVNACSSTPATTGDVQDGCTAQYGKGHDYMNYLDNYVNLHINRSMQYLLMASHFATYAQSREGYEKLFRKLSDETWEDAVDLMKYITMRGGTVHLKPYTPDKEDTERFHAEHIQLNELQSLGKAVDIQKKLAEEAHRIYNRTNDHDPEMGSYVEDKFMHKHAKMIRSLVGLVTDLKKLIKVDNVESSVGLQYFILDSYLKKFI